MLYKTLTQMGYTQSNKQFFDTLYITGLSKDEQSKIREIALDCRVNFRYYEDGAIGISVDETTLLSDLGTLYYIFATAKGVEAPVPELPAEYIQVDEHFRRTSDFLQFEVFQKYHTETELMRYIKKLEKRDISLAQSMISLGSCTMKLNAAAELFILSNPQFAFIHPYAPADQTEGYIEMLDNTAPVSYTHLTLPTKLEWCRSRWSPYH